MLLHAGCINRQLFAKVLAISTYVILHVKFSLQLVALPSSDHTIISCKFNKRSKLLERWICGSIWCQITVPNLGNMTAVCGSFLGGCICLCVWRRISNFFWQRWWYRQAVKSLVLHIYDPVSPCCCWPEHGDSPLWLRRSLALPHKMNSLSPPDYSGPHWTHAHTHLVVSSDT